MKLPFSQLEAILDHLTDELKQGSLNMERYVEEWDDIMRFTGWSWDEFLAEIDKRWTPQQKAKVSLFQA